ncbi:MAG TPA: LacI family DNA-binding transcriptional regulator [Acidimicrobiales bacterium]
MTDSTPTIYDVAERAGVSIATVSRALNSLDSVRPATRDKVLLAMEELAFVPNAVARGLSIGKHGILGLVFTRVVGENNGLAVEEASLLYTDIVIRGAETRAAEKGYSLLLSSFDETHPSGMSALLSLTGTVDGLIVMDRVLHDDDVAYLARRIPVVLLAGRGDSPAAITIRVDNESAMSSLARHLVDVHAVSRVGFVTGALESPDATARATGFRSSIEELGATMADVDFLEADWTSAGGEAVMRARLDCDEDLPEVFACANDQMAVGVIFALQERGRRVPDDILVTGFDDITLTRYLNPPLTTIRQSGGVLGSVAVDALVATLDGNEEIERTIVLPVELVVRASCGCASDPEEPLRQLHTSSRVHHRVDA